MAREVLQTLKLYILSLMLSDAVSGSTESAAAKEAYSALAAFLLEAARSDADVASVRYMCV